ncbi:PAS domain-containing protein [Xanthocytophaga agilis]|uniref:histidine kinase n=1 Tax=Xanthocytophaga agilis TaxID=3048010 RepID=A0AAE3R5Q2_9BACT|nr:PAS domain-containing protein [Xanthocytophaga agilis]MDJ1502092.1 PAS domain-containing protein [Xanthocytophaga agilis]
MRNFLFVPDKEKDFQSYMVYVLAIIWTLVTGMIVCIGFFYFPDLSPRWLTLLSTSLAVAAFNLIINHLGYTRLASWSLSLMLWLYVTIPCYSAGGIMAPGIISQMSVILTAGFLLGWRGGLAIGLLTIGTDFLLAYLEVIGLLPVATVKHTPISRWISNIIPFGTILALQYYSTNHLRTSLLALQLEIKKREKAEVLKDEILYDLKERVKELKTLYEVSRILQDEDATTEKLFRQIVQILPLGWQYPTKTAARVCVDTISYTTDNYIPCEFYQMAEMTTAKGTKISIEIVYLQSMPERDEGPFLEEERSLINMLVEMLKVDLERRERSAELKAYKYALDTAAIVSISGVDAELTFVNENFCKATQYAPEELMGKHHSFIWSDNYPTDYFTEMQKAMQDGKPYRGEFCNKTKDNTLYWVDTTIIPFLDENGKIYQYLSINYDITERREAEEKIKQSEQLIRKITSQVPGNTYMFEIEESGQFKVLFMNRGTDIFNHTFDFEDVSKQPEKLIEALYVDDKAKFSQALKEAYRTQTIISIQYRMVVGEHTRWRWLQAIPEKNKDGKIIWYGATADITPLVDYIASIEQFIFDLSHVIRRPIASIMGLTRLIIDNELGETELKEISQKLHVISEEMDKFIRELNCDYLQKRQNTTLNIDISSFIDKRSSLFN